MRVRWWASGAPRSRDLVAPRCRARAPCRGLDPESGEPCSAPVACASVSSSRVGPCSSSVPGPKACVHAGGRLDPASAEPPETTPAACASVPSLQVGPLLYSLFTVPRAGPTNIDMTGGRDANFQERDDDKKKIIVFTAIK